MRQQKAEAADPATKREDGGRHFCTHARDFLLETAEAIEGQLGVSGTMERFTAQCIEDAVKFILPDNGRLLSSQVAYDPRFFDLLHLPYPCCALEFSADASLYAQDSGLAFSAKRIALCFDPHKLSLAQQLRLSELLMEPLKEVMPENALAIMAVYESEGVWTLAGGCVVLDLDEGRPSPLQYDENGEPLVGDLAHAVADRVMLEKGKMNPYGLPARYMVFPMRAAITGLSADAAVESLYIDTIDEVRTSYEFLTAINCSNVGTVTKPAPQQLNIRRKKKGKSLFYEYKVLDLAPKGEDGANVSPGGRHGSPRMHLRRGHIRRLGEKFGHKVLWINATMVNAKPGAADPSTTYKVRGNSVQPT